ncbi:MAG: hypothetical protein ABJ239_11960 [Erythrobacter sp.]
MTERQVPQIFDQARRLVRAARAGRICEAKDAWLSEQAEQDTIERLEFMQFEPAHSLIIGPSSGVLANWLRHGGSEVTEHRVLNEEQPLPSPPDGHGLDLVTTINSLDTVNDLPGALLHLRAALAPDGLAIGHILGAGSLLALRQIMLAADGDKSAARIHPQIDTRAATGLLQRAGFSRQVVDSHRLNVRYSSLDRLISDLREQALTGVLADQPPPISKAGFARAKAAFEALREEDGKVTETFEILTMTGWR